MTNWLIRVSDGTNFINSSKYKIWGIKKEGNTGAKCLLKNVKKGDKLWFIKSNSNGKVLAVATYSSHNDRVLGPLVSTTLTNEELGWTPTYLSSEWDTEIHYINLYNTSSCELYTHIKTPSGISKEDERCVLDLDVEYFYITKYANITNTF
jgi:hypothetical protein